MQLRWGLRSITGDYRENNEDRGFADSDGRFFIVCDGMGGQAAGEKASEMAVTLVSEQLAKRVDFAADSSEKVRKAIDGALRDANGEIMALGELDPHLCKMGTTIVFLLCVAGRFYVGGIGDSPAFRLSDGKFEKVTKDHSLTQALIDAGTITPDEARTHRFKNVLWRYIGTKEGGAGAEPKEFPVTPGDRFLLCSDGVVEGASFDQLKGLAQSTSDPQAAADAIVEAARSGGSQDNITCLVVIVG
ncbi:MAG TPA: protein phosphatase 2C domain-containing protein [Planctomycetaceae bacterium]|jgi:protein phosphatase|nr:protein phosphatase 2C domain-containing protein [Planctomycetaceae bacterium]